MLRPKCVLRPRPRTRGARKGLPHLGYAIHLKDGPRSTLACDPWSRRHCSWTHRRRECIFRFKTNTHVNAFFFLTHNYLFILKLSVEGTLKDFFTQRNFWQCVFFLSVFCLHETERGQGDGPMVTCENHSFHLYGRGRPALYPEGARPKAAGALPRCHCQFLSPEYGRGVPALSGYHCAQSEPRMGHCRFGSGKA